MSLLTADGWQQHAAGLFSTLRAECEYDARRQQIDRINRSSKTVLKAWRFPRQVRHFVHPPDD